MPIEEFYQQIPLSAVVVNREERQRKELVGIEQLAGQIERRGLLHPIIIRRDGNVLMAGERRLTAFKLLASKNPTKWSSIPFRYYENLNRTEALVVELEENLSREDLPWQDTAAAILMVHEALAQGKDEHSINATAEHIGIDKTVCYKNILVAKELRAGNEQVLNSISVYEAYNKVKRGLDRAVGEEMNKLLAGVSIPGLSAPAPAGNVDTIQTRHGGATRGTDPAAPTPPETAPTPSHGQKIGVSVDVPPRPTPPPEPFLQTDFIKWAESYSGEPFNFLHCDFPYGINHQKSAQGKVADYGVYDDTEETYWKLLNALADNKQRLLYPSAHIIFWFSMNHYSATMEFFSKRFPEFTFDPFPLVWWKDRSIAPDVSRRPRRCYETALFGFSGDRKIISTRANILKDEAGDKIHASEKPVSMLRGFFQMVVDHHTKMLDPTCGSGTSVRAAKALKAATVLGIERDPTFYAAAVSAYQRAQILNFADLGVEDAKD